MAASAPNDTNHQPPHPTGDLEHLFRQKFAEAEVTPRAGFWDQLDHELVVQQHEQVMQENTAYRRRLVLHRWVAAACLLLALGFGSWAYLNMQPLGSGQDFAAQPGGSHPAGLRIGASAQRGATTNTPAIEGEQAYSGAADMAAALSNLAAGAAEASRSGTILPADAERYYGRYEGAGSYTASGYSNVASQRQPYGYTTAGYSNGGYTTGTTGGLFSGSEAGAGTAESSAFSGAGLLAPRTAYLRNLLGLGRPDTLKPALMAVPQPSAEALAAVEPEQKETPRLWKRLRLGGSYAVGAFNPNINFSRTDGRVKSDPVSTALRSYYQEEAEDEYRRNLRAGFSQRVALTASYALNKHWTLTSGVEAADQRATSATTYGFIDGKQVGPQAADIFNRPAAYSFAPAQPRTTAYRYRTASVPVGVRYGTNKAGLSLYAKVGAAVSVLLSSRSELEGSPEAARNYTASSPDSPYRQVLVAGRGGAGMRYQPVAAGWSLAVGPVAEAYFTTLNAHPNQRAVNQSRPYSLGIEASVEFGTPKPMPGVQ
ncbi:outer membrane beta-barrel protein [Hymenobacter metallilatus]|uniref:Outer membrane protein beta-barrel domain-containing protein n=1 Tax=Hymenobacter metallilatus TaxID=2493666 RepID=A0A3R9MA42_9BACT|nr:outer membrane beta-barrel protein [Hymenobacter metallilatus]RSK37101.1 hypothetical protein EI290_00080 [Hymenobacter metallilatus]